MDTRRPVESPLDSEDEALSPPDRLLLAVRAADVAAVRELCARHPGLTARPSSGGRLPLVEAADRALLEVARALLEAGADPKAGDPLLLAAHPGPHKQAPALPVIELLLQHGVPDDIFVHALLGRVPQLREALPRVAIDARGPANSTALFLAVWNGQVDAAGVLLSAGADPRLVCRNGQTAWQVAVAHAWSPPHRELGRLLLEHGVECTLHEACVLSHLPTVRRLLAAQPDLVDSVNEAGRTPLDLAVLAADVPLARVLLDAGASDPSMHGRVLIAAQPTRAGRFARSLFRDCSFETTLFHDCNMKDTVLSNINLSGAKLVNVNLSGARIEDAFIKGLTIYGIEIEPLIAAELQRRAAGADGREARRREVSQPSASAPRALEPPRLVGRSSSHFTRLVRLFAEEHGAPYVLQVVPSLLAGDPAAYGSNPALRLPNLITEQGTVFGSLGSCRALARRATRPLRMIWPEDTPAPLAANALELTVQAMSSEVSWIMLTSTGGEGSGYAGKLRAALDGALGWLEHNVEPALAALPERDLSYLELSLFCLLEHLEFRKVLALDPYPRLRRFRDAFALRPSARATEFKFD